VRGPPVGRPLKHSQGSGGQGRAPCPFAVLGTFDATSGGVGILRRILRGEFRGVPAMAATAFVDPIFEVAVG